MCSYPVRGCFPLVFEAVPRARLTALVLAGLFSALVLRSIFIHQTFQFVVRKTMPKIFPACFIDRFWRYYNIVQYIQSNPWYSHTQQTALDERLRLWHIDERGL